MKRFNTRTPFLLAALSIVLLAFTQDTLHTAPPPFEVNRMRPFVSINKAQLAKANTLLDINPRYDADWVRTYTSVEVRTIQAGQVLTKVGVDDRLTPEQKEQLMSADLGTDIQVHVRYMPENNLKQNDLQEMSFTFAVEADTDAKYKGGEQELLDYLHESAIHQLSAESFGEWGMSAVKFTVDEQGHIRDVEAIEPVQDDTVSSLLVASVCNMAQWEPARFEDGTTVSQQYALTVGNQANCKIALLNIRDLE